MLHQAKTLKGYTLNSLDGSIGKVKEFYFDDQFWTIRHLIADTDSWLVDRQVLISPHALGSPDREDRSIRVNLSKKQFEDSPSLDSDKPVSRQFQEDYYGYFGWPSYWDGPLMSPAYPDVIGTSQNLRGLNEGEKAWDPHLRSTFDVTGHRIEALDGEIGHVEDFLIDDETWDIRFMVVDTRNWWPGKKVLIDIHSIERVSWTEAKVFVNLTQNAIKQAKEFKPGALPDYHFDSGRHGDFSPPDYAANKPPFTDLPHDG